MTYQLSQRKGGDLIIVVLVIGIAVVAVIFVVVLASILRPDNVCVELLDGCVHLK